MNQKFLLPWLMSIIFLTALVISGCSSKSTDSSSPSGSSPNPNANSVNEYFAQLPDWEINPPHENTSTIAPSYIVYEDGTWSLDYRCGVNEKTMVETTDEIFSPDQNFGVLWPGALVQGKSISTGQLKTIPLDRAPMTLNISVDAPVTSTVVDVPNSVNAQQAVSELKRSIDANLNGDNAPSHPGTVVFEYEIANSLDQSVLSMGITAGYSVPMSEALSGSAHMNISREFTTQTIVAKLVQKLFTIRIADDLPELRTPAGFFDPSVTLDDLEEQEIKGHLGAENLPMYIESVTYGRIIIFTLTSFNCTDVDSVGMAFNAKFGQYQGGGDIDAAFEKILSSKEIKVYQAGGTSEAARAAIQNFDFSLFFTEIPATSAVPLSFRLKPMKGGALADYISIWDSATYTERQDCDRPYGYEVTVDLTKVRLVDAKRVGCVGCEWESELHHSKNGLSPWLLGAGLFFGKPIIEQSGLKHKLRFLEPGRSDLIPSSFRITSLFNVKSLATPVYDYPFEELGRLQWNTIRGSVRSLGAEAEFNYRVWKEPLYH